VTFRYPIRAGQPVKCAGISGELVHEVDLEGTRNKKKMGTLATLMRNSQIPNMSYLRTMKKDMICILNIIKASRTSRIHLNSPTKQSAA